MRRHPPQWELNCAITIALMVLLNGLLTQPAQAQSAAERCDAVASGGTLTTFEASGSLYCVRTFNGNDTFQWTGPSSTNLDVLVVGGGGGGGAWVGGGGGGGGVISSSGVLVTSGASVAVNVGAGGVGADFGDGTSPPLVRSATSGGQSSFGNIVANGGGHGASYSSDGGGQDAAIGGTGGGGGVQGGARGGVATAGQGANGGDGDSNLAQPHVTGGGGGAGGSGENGNASGKSSGNGGVGRVSTITGSSVYYGGGGGGGIHGITGPTGEGTAGLGGDGGGGAGGGLSTGANCDPCVAASGTDGLGGGGGGSGGPQTGSSTTSVASTGGDGGDGVVIVRYEIDITAPTVVSVSVPPNGRYKATDTLSFTVNTSEAVTVTGTPQITVTIGSTTRQATYVSGTGTSALVFSYTVQASETDTDGITVGSLSANGGTLKDAAGNDMNLTLNSVDSTADVLVDTTAPSVSIQNAPTAVNSTTAFSVTLEFSESVTGFTLGDIAVANGAASSLSGSGTTYTADITPDGNGTIEIDVAANVAQDPAGNNNTAATQVTVTYDIAAPTAPTIGTSNSTTLSGTAEAGSTVTIYASDGTTLATTTADGSGNWSITNPLSDGETGSITVTDSAGNTSSATAIAAVDATAPTAPTIDTSNGTTLSGTAEAGSTVTIYASDGTTLATTTADGSGNWSITNPLSDGETGSITVTDTAGNTSSATAIAAVDATAPTAPTIDTSNGTTLSGTAEAGSTVTIYASDGTTLATTTADGSGNWSITNPLSDGETGSITVTDTAGNTSSATAIAAVDATAPTAPTIDTSNGTTLSGTAEAGSTVTIYASDGTTLATTTADGSGNWSITNPLSDGETGSITVTDTAGNTSSATAIAAVDATAPTAPTIDTSNGTTLSGTAEAGSTVTIYASDGTTLATTTADGSGNWSITNPLSDGETGSITVTDTAGNTSSATAIAAVDATAPTAPTIDTSNGTTLSGTAEAGSTVTIYASDGTTLATTTADGSGNWSITNPLSDGETGSITVTDTAGNTSSATAIAAVDATAPTAPTIDTSNGTTLSGTAEAGSTVTIYASDGTTLATTTADGSGNWSITNPLSDGETGSITVTDSAGNTSSATAIAAVDATAPTAPTIDTSNGTTLSGTAEAGSTVTIYASDGTTLATTTADGSGNWSITNPLSDGETGSITVTDTAGNTSSATAIAAVDATAPTAPTIDTSNGTTLSGTAEAGSTVTIYASDGTTLATTTADGSGNWSITNPLSDGETGSITVTDTAGNTSSATAIAAVDATAPTAPTIDTSNGTTLSGTAEAGSTVTIYASDGTTLATTTADGSGNWSITNPLSDGETGSITVTDTAGNTSSATAIAAVDATAPTVTLSSNANNPHSGPFTVTATFSEAVTGFVIGDVTVGNGAASNFAGTGTTYTFDVTPAADGDVTVDVGAGVAQDSAGNGNMASNQVNVLTDSTPPTVVITGPENGVVSDFTVTFTFSENVTGFEASDVTVSNGSKGTFSGSNDLYTLVITNPVLGTIVSVSVDANQAFDAAGNGNEASNVFEVQAGSPASEFEKYQAEIREVIVEDAARSLTSTLSANRRMTQQARNRFVEGRAQMDNEPYGLVSRNNVPFDVNGTFALRNTMLSTRGSFFEQTGNYEGTQRRLVFGDFDVQHDGDTGSTTATLTARFAWEQMTSDRTMLGYFIGGELASSNIDGVFEGDQDRVAVTAGGYAVHKLADQVYLDGFLSYGVGRNNLEMANDTLALTSDYTTRTATAGAALSGVYEYERYEFRPELAFSYGQTWIGNVGFTGRAYGLVDETLSLDAGNISMANLTLRPEVVLAIDAATVSESLSQFSFAPRVICERMIATIRKENCGGGAEIGLSSTSEDGLSNAELRVIVDRVGSSNRSSFAVNLEHRF